MAGPELDPGTPAPRRRPLEDAASVEQHRTASGDGLLTALLDTLSEPEQQWVRRVLTRNHDAERQAALNGETRSGPVW